MNVFWKTLDAGFGSYTIRQIAILEYLATNQDRRLSSVNVSHELKMPAPAVTRATDKLVDFRLAYKTKDPDDKRRTILALTDYGREKLKEIKGVVDEL